jgi:hypothetical protein
MIDKALQTLDHPEIAKALQTPLELPYNPCDLNNGNSGYSIVQRGCR